MRHIERIKEGGLKTTILLKDDNNKKSKIKVNSLAIQKEIDLMGCGRKMAKIPKIMSIYSKVASEDEVKYAQANMKENIYNILSTKSLIAVERAFQSGNLEDETVKEFFGIFWKKDKSKQKNMDNLKVDVKPVNNGVMKDSINKKNVSKEEENIK